jgi:putative AbiEii toxin of type IV toxin-antitoxin system
MALGLKQGPLASSLAEMERRYGVDLDANSHGQSFLKLFQSRFVPGGLYLLDEPEAPLSPQSQLALIAMMDEMVGQNGQFIIATHSPILLAFPGARIYTFDRTPVEAVEYDALDHVRLTRDFLNAPALSHADPENRNPLSTSWRGGPGVSRDEQGELPNPDRHPDLRRTHGDGSPDALSRKRAVWILGQAVCRYVFHDIVVNAPEADIEPDLA